MSIQYDQHRNFFTFPRPYGATLNCLFKRLAEKRQTGKFDAAVGDFRKSELRDIGFRREMQVSRGGKGQVGLGRDAIADSILWQARTYDV